MKSPKRFLMNVEAFWVDHDSKKKNSLQLLYLMQVIWNSSRNKI